MLKVKAHRSHTGYRWRHPNDGPAIACGRRIDDLFRIPAKVNTIWFCLSKRAHAESHPAEWDGWGVVFPEANGYPLSETRTMTMGEADRIIGEFLDANEGNFHLSIEYEV